MDPKTKRKKDMMCFWKWVSGKIKRLSACLKNNDRLVGKEAGGYKNVSSVEVELIERAFELEEKRHELETKKELDKVQITFSRILMAAAILTLGLILLSSFEIPYVTVSSEFVKLMINTAIVEIAGIVTLVLTKHLGKEDKKEE